MGCVSLVPYDEEFACRQEFMSKLDDLSSAVEVIFESVVEIVKSAAEIIVAMWDKIQACIIPPRVLYLSKHGKTARVRKKNRNRIARIWKKLLKEGLS